MRSHVADNSAIKKFGRRFYSRWMQFARMLGNVNTRVILTIGYVVLIGPARLITWLLRRDFLDLRQTKSDSYWRHKVPLNHTLEESKHQF